MELVKDIDHYRVQPLKEPSKERDGYKKRI